MSWSCGKMGYEKNDKESKCPESRGEMEAGKKTEIAMEDCFKSDKERMGEKLKEL